MDNILLKELLAKTLTGELYEFSPGDLVCLLDDKNLKMFKEEHIPQLDKNKIYKIQAIATDMIVIDNISYDKLYFRLANAIDVARDRIENKKIIR